MKRKLFCILLSLSMLLCFMPQAAWAETLTNTSNANTYTYYIEKGKITVNVDTNGVQTVEQFIGDSRDSNRTDTVPAGSEIVLTQTDSNTSTSNYIDIYAAKNQTVRVTLKDVNINTNNEYAAPLSVSGGKNSNVIIELDGTNVLDGDSTKGFPGLYKDGSGTMTICDDNKIAGKLTANGGYSGDNVYGSPE